MSPIIADLLLAHERTTMDGNWVEPLNPVLADISWAEAFWKPSAEEHSVADLVAHLSLWADWVTGFFGGLDFEVEEWPQTGPATEENWNYLRTTLAASYDLMSRAMAALSVSDLEEKPVPEITQMTRLQGILSITLHAAYHCGQIIKLREQYARFCLRNAGSAAR